jgi:hypothetical protein
VTPEDLLAGPRGRRTCWELRAVEELTDRTILTALARSVDDAMYWQEPHAEDIMLAHADARSGLQPVAAALCASSATGWWARPADLDDQHLVAFDGIPGPILTDVRTRLTEAVAAQRRSAMTGVPHGVDWRTCSGHWWSAPILLPSVVTTRSLPGLGPARLGLTEDSMGWDTATAWRATSTRPPRIYEIGAPGDWIELVRRYPLDVSVAKRGDWWRTTGRDGRWLMPDWSAVADDFDAVHVSVLGYLRCAGVPLDVDDAAATLLAGWDPDATFWFDDIVEFAGPPTRWQRDADSAEWHAVDQ